MLTLSGILFWLWTNSKTMKNEQWNERAQVWGTVSSWSWSVQIQMEFVSF